MTLKDELQLIDPEILNIAAHEAYETTSQQQNTDTAISHLGWEYPALERLSETISDIAKDYAEKQAKGKIEAEEGFTRGANFALIALRNYAEREHERPTLSLLGEDEALSFKDRLKKIDADALKDAGQATYQKAFYTAEEPFATDMDLAIEGIEKDYPELDRFLDGIDSWASRYGGKSAWRQTGFEEATHFVIFSLRNYAEGEKLHGAAPFLTEN